MLKGVMFDFDDTIVYSEQSRFESLNEVLREFNIEISLDEWKYEYKRFSSRQILSQIMEKNSLNYDIEKMYHKAHDYREDQIKQNGMEKVKGFDELYMDLKRNGVKIIIVSGGSREHIALNLKIIGLEDVEYIGIEDFTEVKPSSKCFEIGLVKLGLSRDEVLVFEDSYTGLLAAKNAGIKIIGVNTSLSDEIRSLEPIALYQDYSNLSYEKLNSLF